MALGGNYHTAALHDHHHQAAAGVVASPAASLICGADQSGSQRAALVQAALTAVGRAGGAWELTKLVQEDGGAAGRAQDKHIHRPSLIEVKDCIEKMSYN